MLHQRPDAPPVEVAMGFDDQAAWWVARQLTQGEAQDVGQPPLSGHFDTFGAITEGVRLGLEEARRPPLCQAEPVTEDGVDLFRRARHAPMADEVVLVCRHFQVPLTCSDETKRMAVNRSLRRTRGVSVSISPSAGPPFRSFR